VADWTNEAILPGHDSLTNGIWDADFHAPTPPVWPRGPAGGLIGPMSVIATWWAPLPMLLMSNVFMTVAWCGHLKHQDTPLPRVILTS